MKRCYICISWYDPVADGNRMQSLDLESESTITDPNYWKE